MTLIVPSLNDVFNSSKTIAIIGCSANEYRTSNYIAKFLMDKGYKIIPVNPNEDEILGETCYPSLNDIPDSFNIDIVNIFRANEHTAGVVNEVVTWQERTNQTPVIWTQLDVSSPEAEKIAASTQLPYIKNKCIMVEWERI